MKFSLNSKLNNKLTDADYWRMVKESARRIAEEIAEKEEKEKREKEELS